MRCIVLTSHQDAASASDHSSVLTVRREPQRRSWTILPREGLNREPTKALSARTLGLMVRGHYRYRYHLNGSNKSSSLVVGQPPPSRVQLHSIRQAANERSGYPVQVCPRPKRFRRIDHSSGIPSSLGSPWNEGGARPAGKKAARTHPHRLGSRTTRSSSRMCRSLIHAMQGYRGGPLLAKCSFRLLAYACFVISVRIMHRRDVCAKLSALPPLSL